MRRIFFYVLLAGALALPAAGQSNYGDISGTVRDSQHLPVAGATIKLTASSTLAVRPITTNNDGHFEAPALLPDEYEIKTEASALDPPEAKVGLEIGQRRTS